MKLATTIVILLASVIPHQVLANNVGGVFGPVIKPNDSALQFRVATSPSEHGGQDLTTARLHYQQAINADFRWRIVAQMRDTTGSYEYDNAAAELLWQFKHKQDGIWDSALRVDFRTRKGDRPENVALNWTNQWQINSKVFARALTSLSWQFGGNDAPSGTFVQARANIVYKTNKSVNIGIDLFSNLGKLGDFGRFDEQSHQIGPTVSGKIGETSYMLGYLAGVSDGARDDVFRLWFTRTF